MFSKNISNIQANMHKVLMHTVNINVGKKTQSNCCPHYRKYFVLHFLTTVIGVVFTTIISSVIGIITHSIYKGHCSVAGQVLVVGYIQCNCRRKVQGRNLPVDLPTVPSFNKELKTTIAINITTIEFSSFSEKTILLSNEISPTEIQSISKTPDTGSGLLSKHY